MLFNIFLLLHCTVAVAAIFSNVNRLPFYLLKTQCTSVGYKLNFVCSQCLQVTLFWNKWGKTRKPRRVRCVLTFLSALLSEQDAFVWFVCFFCLSFIYSLWECFPTSSLGALCSIKCLWLVGGGGAAVWQQTHSVLSNGCGCSQTSQTNSSNRPSYFTPPTV